MVTTLLGSLTLLIWLYLALARGGFWRGRERDDTVEGADLPPRQPLPAIAAIVPARDEAEIIEASIRSLLAQDYAGPFSIILVDDQSSDGTADLAHAAAKSAGRPERLTVLQGEALPAGWTGKLWAMEQGFRHAESLPEPPEYVLFTDADIAHAPGVVTRLLGIGRARGAVLVSLMARLRCESAAERWLVPAFIYFFQKLYPFAWVNDPARRVAAAAGGCMLIERAALARAGGPGVIRGALIDDCAMGALLKKQGPVWLGLTEAVVSLRPYPRFDDIRRMVSRSAYAQLNYSPLQLVGAVAGMLVTYLAPPCLALFTHGPGQWLGAAAWLVMALSYIPILRFYDLSPHRALALPLVAAIYTGMTLDSALGYWRGRGGAWKGRFQAGAASQAGAAPQAGAASQAGADKDAQDRAERD